MLAVDLDMHLHTGFSTEAGFAGPQNRDAAHALQPIHGYSRQVLQISTGAGAGEEDHFELVVEDVYAAGYREVASVISDLGQQGKRGAIGSAVDLYVELFQGAAELAEAANPIG